MRSLILSFLFVGGMASAQPVTIACSLNEADGSFPGEFSLTYDETNRTFAMIEPKPNRFPIVGERFRRANAKVVSLSFQRKNVINTSGQHTSSITYNIRYKPANSEITVRVEPLGYRNSFFYRGTCDAT